MDAPHTSLTKKIKNKKKSKTIYAKELVPNFQDVEISNMKNLSSKVKKNKNIKNKHTLQSDGNATFFKNDSPVKFHKAEYKNKKISPKRKADEDNQQKAKKIKKNQDIRHNKNELKYDDAEKMSNKNSSFKKSSKNKKKHAKNLNTPADFEESESSDEEDQSIRSEIERLTAFQKIQKLFNNEHSLCIGNSEDEDRSSMVVEKATTSSDKIKKSKCNDSSKLPQKKNIKDESKNIEEESLLPDYAKMYREKGVLCRDSESKSKKKQLTYGLNKARANLQAAKFRYLNEKLYTEHGNESFKYFQKNTDEFMDYHAGYSQQVSKWPINPVDKIIKSFQNTKHQANKVGIFSCKNRSKEKYRMKHLVIADMGCGDAQIARTLTKSTVHSFDMVALNEHVTPCNISKVPLSDQYVDVVVFCLSLMGTNLKDYLQEARRILKTGGLLKIAEVVSRIPDINKFIISIESHGFTLENNDVKNKMFVFLDFKKNEKKPKEKQSIVLNPCLYKKR